MKAVVKCEFTVNHFDSTKYLDEKYYTNKYAFEDFVNQIYNGYEYYINKLYLSFGGKEDDFFNIDDVTSSYTLDFNKKIYEITFYCEKEMTEEQSVTVYNIFTQIMDSECFSLQRLAYICLVSSKDFCDEDIFCNCSYNIGDINCTAISKIYSIDCCDWQ